MIHNNPRFKQIVDKSKLRHELYDRRFGSEIRSLISDIGGHATLMRAPNDIRSITPVFQPQNPGVAALSARIKQNFDPQGILNPGKILLAGL